jgi:hypothetical protein
VISPYAVQVAIAIDAGDWNRAMELVTARCLELRGQRERVRRMHVQYRRRTLARQKRR